MSRDQAYGGIILLVGLLVVPVFLGVLAVLVICMWIGWTMLTTPPPAPLETEMPTPPPTETPAKLPETEKSAS